MRVFNTVFTIALVFFATVTPHIWAMDTKKQASTAISQEEQHKRMRERYYKVKERYLLNPSSAAALRDKSTLNERNDTIKKTLKNLLTNNTIKSRIIDFITNTSNKSDQEAYQYLDDKRAFAWLIDTLALMRPINAYAAEKAPIPEPPAITMDEIKKIYNELKKENPQLTSVQNPLLSGIANLFNYRNDQLAQEKAMLGQFWEKEGTIILEDLILKALNTYNFEQFKKNPQGFLLLLQKMLQQRPFIAYLAQQSPQGLTLKTISVAMSKLWQTIMTNKTAFILDQLKGKYSTDSTATDIKNFSAEFEKQNPYKNFEPALAAITKDDVKQAQDKYAHDYPEEYAHKEMLRKIQEAVSQPEPRSLFSTRNTPKEKPEAITPPLQQQPTLSIAKTVPETAPTRIQSPVVTAPPSPTQPIQLAQQPALSTAKATVETTLSSLQSGLQKMFNKPTVATKAPEPAQNPRAGITQSNPVVQKPYITLDLTGLSDAELSNLIDKELELSSAQGAAGNNNLEQLIQEKIKRAPVKPTTLSQQPASNTYTSKKIVKSFNEFLDYTKLLENNLLEKNHLKNLFQQLITSEIVMPSNAVYLAEYLDIKESLEKNMRFAEKIVSSVGAEFELETALMKTVEAMRLGMQKIKTEEEFFASPTMANLQRTMNSELFNEIEKQAIAILQPIVTLFNELQKEFKLFYGLKP